MCFFSSHSFVSFRSNVSIHWFHLIFWNAATIWTAWINKKSSYLHFFFLIDIDMEIWLRGFEMIMSSSELNFRRRQNIKRMKFLSHFFFFVVNIFFSSMLRKSRTFEFMSQFSAYKLNISIMIRDWIFFKMHLVSDKIRENTPNDF